MGLDGDYNLRRLERYLVLATASGAAAMVALNKRDIYPEWQARLAEVQALTAHSIALSAHESVAPIAEAVRGRTVVLLGSSAQAIDHRKRSRGRRESNHPTRKRVRLAQPPHNDRRMLIDLPGGGALIDTPGLRELALWAGEDSVDEVFDNIAALARQCRFTTARTRASRAARSPRRSNRRTRSGTFRRLAEVAGRSPLP